MQVLGVNWTTRLASGYKEIRRVGHAPGTSSPYLPVPGVGAPAISFNRQKAKAKLRPLGLHLFRGDCRKAPSSEVRTALRSL